jgi:hypothetical protein
MDDPELMQETGNEPGERNYEAEARAEGWKPIEQYKGDKAKWIDAKEFVERGENILPLVKAQNSKLKGELEATKQSIAEMRASMDEFKLFHQETAAKLKKDAKEAYAKAEADLKAARKQAREIGDDDKVDEINDALVELKDEAKAAEKNATKSAPTNKSSEDISKTPEFQAWAKENEWFGQDERRSRLAVAVGQELRAKNPNIGIKEFLEKVSEEVAETFGEKTSSRNTASKVEGSRRGTGTGGKSYADLPSEARKQCDEDIKRHVGPNKVYKTAKEYQSYFANLYFEE